MPKVQPMVSKDVLVLSGYGIPLLIGLLVSLLLGLIAWGFFRSRTREASDPALGGRDNLILGLLALAAFALGVFMTYVILGIRF